MVYTDKHRLTGDASMCIDVHRYASICIDVHRNCKTVQNSRISTSAGRFGLILDDLSSLFHGGYTENQRKEHGMNAPEFSGIKAGFAQFAVCTIGLQIAIAQIAQTCRIFPSAEMIYLLHPGRFEQPLAHLIQ